MKKLLVPSGALLFVVFLVAPQLAFAAAHVENGVAHTRTCSGTAVGVFCDGEFYTDVSFSRPFSAPPTVFVTPNHMTNSYIGDGGECVGSSMDALLCHAESVTKNGFRLYCSGSPQGDYCGAYGSWWAKASANWIALDNDDSVQSGHGIMPTGCAGSNVGSLCSTLWHTDISFPAPFLSPPNVLVSPEHVSAQGGCVGGTTDAVACYPSNITSSGFRLSCGGSPAWGACGDYSGGYASLAKAGWLAKASTSDTGVQSGHGIETTLCDGSLYPSGVCYGNYYRDVTFPHPFDNAPRVIVSPEHVSTGPACVGGGTDALLCEARNVTTTGFRAVCWGSPQYGECGYPDESGTTKATFGYLAISDSSSLSCSITFDQNPIPSDGSTTIHWSSSNAQLFYINTIGYVGASGSATVAPEETTDFSGYVNDKADGTGTTVPCPAATLAVSAVQCPTGYTQQGDQCVFSACPSGYVLQGNTCVLSNQCTTPPHCSGNDLVNSCTAATIQSCAHGCASGECIVIPAPTATLSASPSLVHSGDTTVVSWTSQNTSSCNVTGSNGDSWTGLTSSGKTSQPILAQTIYNLHCVGLAGATPSAVDKTVTVNLIPQFNEK